MVTILKIVGVMSCGFLLCLGLFNAAQAEHLPSVSSLDPHYSHNKGDLRLKLDVKREIALSPFVDADFIHVTVKDGVVTLRGSVEDQSAAEAAIANAKEAGAKKVINKLSIEEK